MLLGAAVLLGGVQAAVVQGQLQLNGTLEIDAFAELTSKAVSLTVQQSRLELMYSSL